MTEENVNQDVTEQEVVTPVETQEQSTSSNSENIGALKPPQNGLFKFNPCLSLICKS